MASVSITSSKHAWNLLRGITCIYKPSGMGSRAVLEQLKERLTSDLNQLQRQHEIRPPNGIIDDYTNSIDYSLHPLVLGDGFEKDDIRMSSSRFHSYRISGLLLVHVNDFYSLPLLRSQRFPTTYHVDMTLGLSTDSSFYDGKVLQKSTYDHLCGRPQILEKLMASIRASFHRESFKLSSFDLQSQEAYELAAKGPIKPTIDGPPLVYNLRCIKYSPPDVTLEMTCINENYEFIVDMVAEMGRRLKTDAVCSKIRCVRVGIFSVDDALLLKHLNLQNVLNNMSQNDQRLKDYSIRFRRRRGNFTSVSQL